ncbi:MAG: hypothetical protein HOH77_01335 [Candidatus Latescibacteria bacterium]|nr:hypothetical protein [Candidatus Latescibacterota bacterium]
MAPDFSFDGHDGNMGRMIMQQIVAQYPTSVDSITIQKVEKSGPQFSILAEFYSAEQREEKVIILSNDFKIVQAPIVKIQMAGHNAQQTNPQSLNDESPARMVVPFKLAGRLIVVEAEIEGVRGNFILDSGAANSCLNARIFPQLQDQAKPVDHKVYGVGGAIQEMKWIVASGFKWQDAKLDVVKALYMDLSHLEENTGTQIVGLIGADFLQKFTVQFDYAHRELTLFSVNPESYWQTAPDEVINFSIVGHIPVIDAQIGDHTLRFGLDSGAEGAQLFAKWEEPLTPHYAFLRNDNLKGADTNSRTVKKVRLDEFLIGDIAYLNHTFVIADINWGHESVIDGLLGFEFLSTHKTAIDFQNQKLYFWRDQNHSAHHSE